MLGPALSAPTYPFRASGPQILDSAGVETQFRCVNWAGHMEANVPEGLQMQKLDDIVDLLASQPTYNCVRLTYAAELFDKTTMTLRESFQPGNNNADTDLSPLVANITKHNPELVDMTLPAVFEAVVDALAKRDIFVLMSNHVSRSMWCCGQGDGNGWWGDEYFDVDGWTKSLEGMAALMAPHPNVVALDLRNELRNEVLSTDDQIRDWMKFMPKGVAAVLAGDASMLVFVSGLSYDNDLTFLDRDDLISDDWASQLEHLVSNIVFEGHIYSWSPFGEITDDCSQLTYVRRERGALIESASGKASVFP
ncbi:hypothetical protein TeGR_g5740 [Tetraparma gracilis]|uniref:Glycoside hydrolase family 5 domain-containing protein n=1 Tax=Tetraparma gracilis TaxID=2962635 RepID=A0ABQ6MI36_9STRA|nr:hypothetical protein TeGR_g5740 [Tetraparma gracilis]